MQNTTAQGKEISEEQRSEEKEQLVVFRLDDEEYAAMLTDLKEIVRISEITPIPNAVNYVKGLINLRGKIVVVVDLEKKFNLVRKLTKKTEHIIIVELENGNFGILVDKVTEVLRVNKRFIKSPENLSDLKISQEFIKGVVLISTKKENKEEEAESQGDKKPDSSRIIVLLDIKKLLSSEQIQKAQKQLPGKS